MGGGIWSGGDGHTNGMPGGNGVICAGDDDHPTGMLGGNVGQSAQRVTFATLECWAAIGGHLLPG